MIMLDLIQPTAFVGAVGVEEINGLVQNAKWFVVRMRMLHQGDISINHKYG